MQWKPRPIGGLALWCSRSLIDACAPGEYRRKIRRLHSPQRDHDSQPLYIQGDAGLHTSYGNFFNYIVVQLSLVRCEGCGLQALYFSEARRPCVSLLWLTWGWPSMCCCSWCHGFHSISRRQRALYLMHMRLINYAVYQEGIMRLIARCA